MRLPDLNSADFAIDNKGQFGIDLIFASAGNGLFEWLEVHTSTTNDLAINGHLFFFCFFLSHLVAIVNKFVR